MLMAGAAYRLGNLDADSGQFDRPMPVISGCGAAVLYRREVFVAAGGLDVEFFAYLDDLDLGLRAQLLGYGGLYLPDAVAYHIGSATLGDTLHPRVIEYLTRNQIYLLSRIIRVQCCVACCRELRSIRGCGLCLRCGTARPGRVFPWLDRATSRDGEHARQTSRTDGRSTEISDDEFLTRLQDSERQIYEWHQSRPPQDRSALLNFYFRIFGRP